MLIEFTVGNFRSFRDTATLSMVASPLKSKDPAVDANNIFELNGQPPLLTSAAVYGANAGGKSNLVQALAFMREFVQESLLETQATGTIAVEPFRLSTESIDQPAHFETVFVAADGKRYRYGFEVTTERVEAEWLYVVPTTREARLFERTRQQVTLGERFKEGRDLESRTRPNALFLSVVAQFNGPIAQKVLAWFRRLGVISGLFDSHLRPYTLRKWLQGEDVAEMAALIQRLDLGIDSVIVEKGAGSVASMPVAFPAEFREAMQKLFDLPGVEQVTVSTLHTQYDAAGQAAGMQRFDLDRHESQGTRKLFGLAGPLIETLTRGEVLVIDEMDARLHPLLTRELIALFNSRPSNSRHAQLIFTTHDTSLLDKSLFRRDQIWFVEKDRQGASTLYSLAEFKVRNDKSFERGYVQGRFGAVPYLGDLSPALSSENGA